MAAPWCATRVAATAAKRPTTTPPTSYAGKARSAGTAQAKDNGPGNRSGGSRQNQANNNNNDSGSGTGGNGGPSGDNSSGNGGGNSNSNSPAADPRAGLPLTPTDFFRRFRAGLYKTMIDPANDIFALAKETVYPFGLDVQRRPAPELVATLQMLFTELLRYGSPAHNHGSNPARTRDNANTLLFMLQGLVLYSTRAGASATNYKMRTKAAARRLGRLIDGNFDYVKSEFRRIREEVTKRSGAPGREKTKKKAPAVDSAAAALDRQRGRTTDLVEKGLHPWQDVSAGGAVPPGAFPPLGCPARAPGRD